MRKRSSVAYNFFHFHPVFKCFCGLKDNLLKAPTRKSQVCFQIIDKEMSGLFSDYLSLMLGKPRIRQNNLKTSLRFLGL